MRHYLLCFTCWLVVFHWWLLLRFVPFVPEMITTAGFLQALFWINIPSKFLAPLMGPRHFKVEAFGALPQGMLAYGSIVLFWILVAAILGVATSAILARAQKEKRIQ